MAITLRHWFGSRSLGENKPTEHGPSTGGAGGAGQGGMVYNLDLLTVAWEKDSILYLFH